MQVEKGIINPEINVHSKTEKITDSRFKYCISNLFILISNFFRTLCFKERLPFYEFKTTVIKFKNENEDSAVVSSNLSTEKSESLNANEINAKASKTANPPLKSLKTDPKVPLNSDANKSLIQTANTINNLSTVALEVINPELKKEAEIIQSNSKWIGDIEILPIGGIEILETDDQVPDVQAQFGPKYQGNQEVNNLIRTKQIVGVEVPSLTGLSHQQIYSFLKQIAPGIFEKWKFLNERYEKDPNLFLDNEEVIKDLKMIRKAIKFCFNDATNGQPLKLFNQLDEWLEEIKENSSYIMVRSSGLEDMKELANAGGNASIGYVDPKKTAILSACGEVVASYFSTRSLKNCIESGINPFSKPPTLSILLQKLIGETIGGEPDPDNIPVSLVMFTTEPSYSEEKFSVSKICASYGHGEGIVKGNQVNCDVVLAVKSEIDPSEIVEIYQNQKKPERLAPILNVSNNQVQLKLVENSSQTAKSRCLSKEIVKRLMDLGSQIESHFGYPVDMEIVIKNNIIYVVQARPIVRPEKHPTYLNDRALIEKNPFLQVEYGQVDVLGKEEIVSIHSPTEILICNTLEEADKGKYIHGQHKIIIFKKPEKTVLSHPIVNFNSRGIPCFYLADTTEIEKMVSQLPAVPMIACPQSGRICLWDKSCDVKDYIVEGYFSHPANIQISLDEVPNPSLQLIHNQNKLPIDVLQALRAIKEAVTDECAYQAIRNLKATPMVASLKNKIKDLKEEVKKSEAPKIAKSALEILKGLKSRIKSTFSELESSIDKNSPRLTKLFHIKSLAALLSQESDAQNTYSLLDADPLVKRVQELRDYQKTLNFPAQLAHLLYIKDYTLNPEVSSKWKDFLLEIEQAIQNKKIQQEDLNKFNELIMTIEKFSALPMWFNFFFLRERGEMTSVEIFRQLLTNYDRKDLAILQLMDNKYSELQLIKKKIDNFGKISTFDDSWSSLEKLGTFVSDSEKFIPTLHKSSAISKMIANELFREYVEVFDTSLKMMKSSSEFKDDKKIELMGNMLEKNLAVLGAWFESLIGINNLKGNYPWTAERYLQFLDQALKKCKRDNFQTLHPSDVSVLAATFRSLANYDRHVPKTMEDVFSVIHQNQLYCLEILNRLIMPPYQTLVLPQILKKCINQRILKNTGSTPHLCGTHFTKEGMEWHYNIALRNHSATITFESNYNDPTELLLHVKIFGQARDRWPTMILLVRLTGYLGMVKLQNLNPCTQQEMSFTWSISHDNQIPIVWKELDRLLYFTMEEYQSHYVGEFFNEQKERQNKMGQFFFLHPRFVDYSYMNHVDCLDSFFMTDDGENALNKMSHYGTSLDPTVRRQEIKRLEVLIRSMSLAKKKGKMLPKLIDIVKITLPRFVDKGDDLSTVASFFGMTQMYKLANTHCDKFKDSSLIQNIRMVKIIYLDFLRYDDNQLNKVNIEIDKGNVEIDKGDIETFASRLLTFENPEIVVMASELFFKLVIQNLSITNAQACVKKLEEFKYLETHQKIRLNILKRGLAKKLTPDRAVSQNLS